uniref:Uncharacterized protein n=1 Tax=Caenorhabditis tropicalis TaxID=1561998 RepID=A0A1I7U8P2_9PELO
MNLIFENSGFIPFPSSLSEMSKKDFGRKSSNLEQSIQRIQFRRDQKLKSILMAQILIIEKAKYKSRNEENHNQQVCIICNKMA